MDLLKKAARYFLFISLQMVLPNLTDAQSVHWQPNNDGIQAVSVFSFAMDPLDSGHIFAGTTHGGLYETNNHGVSWQQIDNHTFDGKRILQIVINPYNPHEIYANTQIDGIYKSVDQGRTWKIITQGIPRVVRLLAMSPENPQILFASNQKRLLKSIDGGNQWTDTNFNVEDYFPNILAINPLNPNIMMMQGHGGKKDLLRSMDGGISWQALTFKTNDEAYDLKYVGNTLFLAARSGLWKSMDNGLTWGNINLPEQKNGVASIIVNAKQPHEIFVTLTNSANVFKSEDDGKTWTMIYHGSAYLYGFFNKLLVNPNNTQDLYLNVEYLGVLHSTDGGKNWQPANHGFSNVNVNVIAIDPINEKRMYIGTNHGLWITQDGKNWQSDNVQFPQNRVNGVVVDSLNPANIVISLDNLGEQHDSYIYRSTDYGKTWTPAHFDGGTPWRISCLAMNPQNPQQLFSCSWGDSELLQSEDGGKNWFGTHLKDSPNVVAFNPKNPREIYVGGAMGQGIDKSSDGGKTWVHINIDPNLPWILSITVNPAHPDHVYLGTGNAKFYKSTDSGLTWKASYQGLPNNILDDIDAIVVDPHHAETLYVTTGTSEDYPVTGNGVYVSYDDGDHWSALNNGLDNLIPVSLAMNASGKLFAGTIGSGIYAIDGLSNKI